MTRLLPFLLLFATASAHAAGAYSVFATPAQYRFVSGDIQRVCGEETLGCTDITQVALHARCEGAGAAWMPRAAVTFAPVVHLPERAGPAALHAIVTHELAHIHDFHAGAESFARALVQRRFESADTCRAAMLEEEAIFSARMAYFGKLSLALRR